MVFGQCTMAAGMIDLVGQGVSCRFITTRVLDPALSELWRCVQEGGYHVVEKVLHSRERECSKSKSQREQGVEDGRLRMNDG